MPHRKKKCPTCGQFIYVRTRLLDRERILVTEKLATKIDNERAILYKAKDAMRTFNISDNEYSEATKLLTEQFGTKPNHEDIIWSILNNRLISAIRNNDYQEMKMIYRDQAFFLYGEKRDHFKVLQESLKCELLNYKANGFVKEVEILTSEGVSCDKCRLLGGKKFTIGEALEQMPIPVQDCEHGWCRCMYLPVVNL
jgi:hypothetical protein